MVEENEGGSDGVQSYKLYAPQLRSDLVDRCSIVDHVLEGESTSVILLQAPAGYGKSTTLRQIMSACEDRGFKTAWLTFDEADNDPRRFLIHFRALVASTGGTIDTMTGIHAAGRGYRADWAVETLQRLGKPVALFLDDFQALERPAILAFFLEFLEKLPSNAKALISSRSTPDIGLARLIVSERCIVVRPEKLRFSLLETQQFLADLKGMTVSDVNRLHRLTEGWPAALRLYRLSVADPDVRRMLGDFASARPRQLVEYLVDNVLAALSVDIQDFLLRTSLLARLNAPLCDAVTGRTDSGSILLWLEHSGLFVRSLDLRQRWFEYHALFASILSEEQHRRSEAIALEVHGLAAKWHAENGDLGEGVRHAIACQDFAFAADTLDQWCSRLVADALLVTVEQWCDRLPFGAIAERVGLLIKYAWALIFLQRIDKLSPILGLLEQSRPPYDVSVTNDATIVLAMAAIARDDAGAAFRIVDSVPIRARKGRSFTAFELGAAANLVAYRELAYDDFERVHECLATARMQGERGRAPFSQGYTVAIAGVNLLAQGHLSEALGRFESRMAIQRKHVDRSHAAAALASCYLWALYESNRLEEAESVFGQYQDIILESALLDFQAVGHVSMARIHDIQGRPVEALAELDRAEAISHANDWHRYSRNLGWERVRRALSYGDHDRAIAIAAAMPTRREGVVDWLQFSEDLEGESLGRIRLALHTNNSDLAKQLLQTEFARHRRRAFRQIKLTLLDARLRYRTGARNGAQRSFRKALQLAAPGGYIRCFLDEGDEVLDMLREEARSKVDSGGRQVPVGADTAFIERLERAWGIEHVIAPGLTKARPLEPLTEQETKVLALLAKGFSNNEMATHLFISENTVKFHLKHIFLKLGAVSRIQAVARAREFGLVE